MSRQTKFLSADRLLAGDVRKVHCAPVSAYGDGLNYFRNLAKAMAPMMPTAYQTTISIMNARSGWYLALIAIVPGHIFAVYVAHVMALRLYGTSGAAVWSQVPIVVLMIGYTVTSLWILSQPVVR